MANTIPWYIQFYQDTNISTQILVKLKSRLTFVSALCSMAHFVEFFTSILASKPLTYFNTSIDPRQTYAIMDDHDNYERLSTLLKINGSQKLGQPEVSGIPGRWDDLQTVTDVEGVLYLIEDPAYERYTKGVPPTKESKAKETPVPLKAVTSIFILSSFLLLLALTSFGVERRTHFFIESTKHLKKIGLVSNNVEIAAITDFGWKLFLKYRHGRKHPGKRKNMGPLVFEAERFKISPDKIGDNHLTPLHSSESSTARRPAQKEPPSGSPPRPTPEKLSGSQPHQTQSAGPPTVRQSPPPSCPLPQNRRGDRLRVARSQEGLRQRSSIPSRALVPPPSPTCKK
ncbi:hypothetical protein Fcan01_27854 [Folsomia candida]|uniref:Uncharacterized protein n=1 Tax=Folsomia candida TaxID=158441 RepID=A0A226CWL6_FOLCA|nr:hypothetical protein Fcan01_27854 [Folsomia candida]